MLRGIYGDPERYQDTYWSRFEGRYFAGDGAKLDGDGYLWVLGRVDDVMNVSGHRISTTEVESALVDNPKVAEAAVVGAKDDTTGQAIVAFVTLRGTTEASDEVGAELREHVADKIGKIGRPKTIIFTDDLPKTRSGKIMRRLLRDVAEGRSWATPPRSPTPAWWRSATGPPPGPARRTEGRALSPAGGPQGGAVQGQVQPGAGPVDPRAHGPQGHIEDGGDLGVAQPAYSVEEKGVPIDRRETVEPLHHPSPVVRRHDPAQDGVLVEAGLVVGAPGRVPPEPAHRAEPPFAAVVVAQDVEGDAHQPGGVGPERRVVVVERGEGGGEGLGRRLLGQRRAHPPTEEGVDAVHLGLVEGDEPGLVRDGLIHGPPPHGSRGEAATRDSGRPKAVGKRTSVGKPRSFANRRAVAGKERRRGAATLPADPPMTAPAPDSHPRPRILLAEDDARLAGAYARRLGAEHLAVDVVGTVAEAREHERRCDYACLLLDRLLPDGDVLELVREIDERVAHPPIVLVSAVADQEDRVEGLRAGADDYVAKPVHLDELAVRVTRLVGGGRARPGPAPGPARRGGARPVRCGSASAASRSSCRRRSC